MGHRFECFLQHDSMQCGIACLAMICKHYGKEFSIETLSRYCFASAEGRCENQSRTYQRNTRNEITVILVVIAVCTWILWKY